MLRRGRNFHCFVNVMVLWRKQKINRDWLCVKTMLTSISFSPAKKKSPTLLMIRPIRLRLTNSLVKRECRSKSVYTYSSTIDCFCCRGERKQATMPFMTRAQSSDRAKDDVRGKRTSDDRIKIIRHVSSDIHIRQFNPQSECISQIGSSFIRNLFRNISIKLCFLLSQNNLVFLHV